MAGSKLRANAVRSRKTGGRSAGSPRTVSVITSRTAQWASGFQFHHLDPHLFFGYYSSEVAPTQEAFIAYPEKALLDLAHLTPSSDSDDFLSQLRLQNLEQLDMNRLHEFAERAAKPKWRRVAQKVKFLALQEEKEYESLP